MNTPGQLFGLIMDRLKLKTENPILVMSQKGQRVLYTTHYDENGGRKTCTYATTTQEIQGTELLETLALSIAVKFLADRKK